MFGTLCESRPVRQRRRGGTVASAFVHSVVISLAVYATAHAHVRAPTVPTHPVYWWEMPKPPAPKVPQPGAIFDPIHPTGIFAAPIEIPDSIPPVDLTKPVTDPTTLFESAPHTAPAPVADHGTYLLAQVERPAAVIPGAAEPAYPEALQIAGITGEVQAEFVVDTSGRVEPGSFKVLASDNELFVNAVRAALHRMRFYPAEVGGRRVRQLVQQDFRFKLGTRG